MKWIVLVLVHAVLALLCLSVAILFAMFGDYLAAVLASVGTAVPLVCAMNAYQCYLRS